MLPAISKQRKLQPSSHRSCPHWQAPRALRMEPSRLPPGWQPPPTVHPEGIRVGKKRILAPDSWGQIKGMISVSPDSCIFPYTVQLSSAHSVLSDSLRPHELQHTRPPYPSQTPRVYPNSCPLCRWCHPAISSSVVPFSSCPQSFQYQGLFKWVSPSYQVAKVLEFQLQHQSFQRTPRTNLL